jgi:perosamine synthetase
MAEEIFLPLLAQGSNYPPALLSMLPRREGRKAGAANGVGADLVASAFLNAGTPFRLGRYALAEALRRAGAGPGRSVWMPAMHCRTMPEAAQHVGAPVRYYPMTAQLQPDFVALAALLAASSGPAAALVHVHYFGFPQSLDEVAALCREHGLKLVEDCSHAFYGQAIGQAGAAGPVLGEVGDYAVTSTWKFHPVPYGALLLDRTAQGQNRRRGAPLMHELRSVLAWARTQPKRAAQHPSLQPAGALASLWDRASQLAAMPHPPMGDSESAFKPELARVGAPRLVQRVVRRADHGDIVVRRRARYSQWLAALQGVPGVTPLFSSLPPGVVPYAFPLLADEAGVLFHLLKLAGVPVWRWEDMAQAAAQQCAVTASYRVRLLQLACHQSLSEDDLAWMAQTLRACAELLARQQDDSLQTVRTGAAD